MSLNKLEEGRGMRNLATSGRLSDRTGGVPLLLSLIACLWVSLSACRVSAEETIEARRFRDQAEFSVVNTSGNTNVFTLALKNTFAYDFSRKYIGTWNVSVLSGEQNGEKSSERYSTDLRLDNYFSSGTYAYLLGSWLRDRFAGFDNRYTLGPGLGHKIVDGPRHYLRAEIGCNWAREEYVDAPSESFLEGRAFGCYEYRISEAHRFTQKVEYLHDFDDPANYKIATETAVVSGLNQFLAIKLAYEVRYQNRPMPDTLEDTDTVFSGALVVSY